MSSNLKEIDVLILCGGLGKRLRSCVNDRPKVLAEIGGRPFLEVLIGHLLRYGFKNIILSVGYMREEIKRHFYNKKMGRLLFSEEENPLGTGGAVKKAEALIKSNPFLVINGDSLCKVDFGKFYDFHINKKAILSIVLARSEVNGDYGFITLDASYRITDFREKIIKRENGLISAGIYLMQRDIFSYMPGQKRFSLEYDLFPKMVNNRFYGFLTESEFVDIGTPERYKKAISLFERHHV